MTRHLRLSVINRFATAKVRQKYETCKKSMCTNGGGKMLIINVLQYSMCTKYSVVAILKHIDKYRQAEKPFFATCFPPLPYREECRIAPVL